MTRCSTGRATQKYRGNGTDLSDILETPGDIIYADAAVSAENLVISGTTGDVLKVSASGIPEWGTSTSQWITSGDDISYSLGHVGIGTTSPDANLHVTGNAFVSTDLGLGGTLTMGNVLVEALHELSAITATGNVTPHVIEFTNPTTGLVTTGNVGIGTATPLQTLEVNGSVGINHNGVGGYTFHTSTGALRAGIHSTGGNHLLFKAGSDNERMRLLAGGQLGIGTSTPSKPLTVDGNVHIPSGSDANSGSFPQNSVTRSIYFGGISQSGSMYQSKTAIVSAPWTQYGGTQSWGRHGLHFCVDSVADNGNVELGQTKMCINYLGNVGIGSWSTSNPLPQTMASVHGGRVLEGRDASGFEFMAASSDTTNANGQFNGAFLIKNMDTDGSEPHYVGMAGRGNSTNGSMDLLFYSGRDNYENNTPQMVIDPDGNVGIGTSTPGYTLDVTGDINFTGNLIQNGSAYGSSPWTTTGNDISYTTGRVGVGTISPDANLHVEGNVYMSSNLEVGGATISRTVSYDVPSVSWATSIGGTNSDYGYGIATDSNGNVYVIGFYDNTVTFAPGTTLNSTGGDDAFVAKYDTSGTVQWAKSIGGTSSDNGRGIATDSNGNVYVTGKYSTTATFAPGTTLTSVGSSDAFVAKYNTSGTVQWAMSIGGTSPDYGYGIATDSGGNVYVTGYYRGSVTIGSTTLNSVGGSNDTFVVKYSPPIALHINKSVDVTGDINFTGNLTQNGSAYGGGGSGSSLWTESSGDIQRSSGNVEVGVANLFVNTTTSRVGVGTVSPSVELHVSGTGAIIVPSGTTAERPATGVTSMIRFNNTTYKYEGWGMISWVDLSIADPPGLYSFTSHTFTSCGGDSRYGPQLSDALATYGNISPWNDINLFNIAIRGFQLWTVPETGTYRITARGARGGEESSSAGSYNNTPGSGRAVRADIALTVNTQVVFIVGQTPPQSTGNYRSGSGGGATWVLKPGGGYTNNNDVYMVAGGGGGAGPRHYNSGTAGHADASSQGTLGGGGTTHWNSNGGGAGWTSDGYPNGFRGGVRPAGGAMGGTGTTHGGFGGGGSESGDSAGGGAGAKGGRAALRYDSTGSDTARGGTSYITTNATNRTFLGNHGLTNNGNVYVELLP